MLLHLSALFIGAVWAQRPSDSSLCDYYAKTLYGTSTNVTQFRLIEDIVTMAFGGPFTVTIDVSPNLTGIWNPGNFEGLNVNLRPWFDGVN